MRQPLNLETAAVSAYFSGGCFLLCFVCSVFKSLWVFRLQIFAIFKSVSFVSSLSFLMFPLFILRVCFPSEAEQGQLSLASYAKTMRHRNITWLDARTRSKLGCTGNSIVHISCLSLHMAGAEVRWQEPGW